MPSEAEKAWNNELDTMRIVVGSALGPDADARDINQCATGALLVCTLPPAAFAEALRQIRFECERRGLTLPTEGT